MHAQIAKFNRIICASPHRLREDLPALLRS
jgi:hypothetical protein